ncbi:unnamed protein product, partial [marine sediment metagenome]
MALHSPSDYAFMFNADQGLATESVYSETGGTVNIILWSDGMDDGHNVDLRTTETRAEVQTS